MPKAKVSLKQKIRECTNCELYKGCSGPVPYRGKPSSIMVIGEAPGRTEDQVGRPFVGPAGKRLWMELARVGIHTADVLAANAVCCFPQRTPTGDEIYACRSNLYNQIRRCHPHAILALGRTINWSLGRQQENLSEIRGEWYSLHWFIKSPGFEPGELIRVMPTYHPAAVLRNKTLTRRWREDLEAFAEAALDKG